MELSDVFAGAALSAGPSQQAASAAPSLGQTLADAWDTVVYGVSWFFGNMEPAGIWAIPTLAAAIAFFIYFWKVSAPRKNSLEWIAMAEAQPRQMTLTLKRHPFQKKDVLPMLLVTVIYAVSAFFQLGNTHAPQSYTVFDEDTSISFSYSQVVDVSKISFFTVIGTGSYTLEYSADGVNWSSLELEQPYNSLLKWEVKDLNSPEEGEETPVGPISGRLFRISASDIDRSEGLWLGELVLWNGDTALAPVYVDEGGSALFDEPMEWTAKATYMNSSYFDEIYHPRTALEHLNNVYPYEVSHPPLGKLIMGVGIRLFGMTPFGWRFMGTLFGVGMLPLLYVFLKNLFGRTSIATCGTVLLAADFMHLTQTRLATIDTYAFFFILLMYYFMYRYLTLPAGAPFRKCALPLFLSGLFWGIGAASKWTVIYGCTGLVVLYFIGLYQKLRDWPADGETGARQPGRLKWAFQILAFSVLVFALIPAAIYTLSYLPYAWAEGDSSLTGLVGAMWENQKYMLSYHSGVTDTHPYSSRWYQWLFDIRPILYYMDNSVPGYTTRFAAFVNPVVCWGGLLAVLACAVQAVRRRCARALFIVIGYLAQLVPWFFIGRITFAYHYFPSVLFLILALCYVFYSLSEQEELIAWKPAMYAITAGAAALYALFYPVLVGIQIPSWYGTCLLRWLPSWPF